MEKHKECVMDAKKVSELITVVLWLVGGLLLVPMVANAAPDPNFHIYIAYGQSNMEGNATNFDKNVDGKEHPRVKMFATTSCSNLGRPTVGEMYPAVPPMFKCDQGLSVADWFGRHMADSLPDITIGIIPVAVGGTSIRLFDPDDYKNYLSSAEGWLQNSAKAYGNDGNAMGRIIEVAKKAQEKGVIKGIIFHQGETDGGMSNWEQIVKKTYEYILDQLGLKAEETPFVAGEMVDGGSCAGFSSRVRGLSKYIVNFGVASSSGYGSKGDGLHFTVEGYRGMGLRYAQEMLKLINVEPPEPVERKMFKGAAISIPGKVEAEDFDIKGVGETNGISNVTYKETDSENHGDDKDYRADASDVDIYKKASGRVVGYNSEGDWLEYTVDVKEAGEYDVTVSFATDNSTSGISLSLDGNTIVENIATSGSSWDEFKDATAKATLTAGKHILRMTVTGSWVDIDYLNFAKEGAAPDSGSTDPDSTKQGIGDFRLALPGTVSNYTVVDMQGRKLFSLKAKSLAEAVELSRKNVMQNMVSGGVYFVISNTKGQSRTMQKVVVYEQ